MCFQFVVLVPFLLLVVKIWTNIFYSMYRFSMVRITYIPNFTEICQWKRMLGRSKQSNFNYNHPVFTSHQPREPSVAEWLAHAHSDSLMSIGKWVWFLCYPDRSGTAPCYLSKIFYFYQFYTFKKTVNKKNLKTKMILLNHIFFKLCIFRKSLI